MVKRNGRIWQAVKSIPSVGKSHVKTGKPFKNKILSEVLRRKKPIQRIFE